MRAIEKVNLIKKISAKLSELFSYDDINIFFSAYKIDASRDYDSFYDKEEYIKIYIRDATDEVLKKIAEELEINTNNLVSSPPKNWEQTESIKAFISHTSTDKVNAKRLRDALKVYNIDCFVAHEDIKPSEEWQEEIRKALDTMDFFISIHTKGFSQRQWCQQEVGYAVARGIKIIPIKFEEDPDGFIAKIQALIRGEKKAENIAEDILDILKDSPQTKSLYLQKIKTKEDEEEIPF